MREEVNNLTEEKKNIIARKAEKMATIWELMPEGLPEAIVEWNLDRKINTISKNHLKWIATLANKEVHALSFENLLSENEELAYGTLVSIISRELAKEICKTPELEELFERYVFNIQNANFGDKKKADEICPLRRNRS